jgi:hypothetical protein
MENKNKIKELKIIVHELLLKDKRYRDNDRMLCCRIWANQIGEEKIKSITAYDFLCYYSREDSFLYSTESICRIRRILQEKHPELRGEKYYENHSKQKEVINDLREIKLFF